MAVGQGHDRSIGVVGRPTGPPTAAFSGYSPMDRSPTITIDRAVIQECQAELHDALGSDPELHRSAAGLPPTGDRAAG